MRSHFKNTLFAVAALATASISQTIRAEEAEKGFWSNEALTGDWGGARSTMADHGFAIGLSYAGDVMGVAHGGVERKAHYLGNADLNFTADLEKLAGIPGGSLFADIIFNHGTSPSESVLDTQAFDNIDTGGVTALRLFEFWYLQELADKKFSFLFGLYNLNGEFDVAETDSLFINSSFGMGKEYAQAGPSVFPITGLALRMKWHPSASSYLQMAMLDGVPGDPDDPEKTAVMWNEKEGLQLAAELGLVFGKDEGSKDAYSKLALGTWLFTRDHEDLLAQDSAGEPLLRKGNSGFYFLAERSLFAEGSGSQGLAGSLRVGTADERVNEFGYFGRASLVYTGLFPSRDDDQFGGWSGDGVCGRCEPKGQSRRPDLRRGGH